MSRGKTVYDELGRVYRSIVCNPRLELDDTTYDIVTENTYDTDGTLKKVTHPDNTLTYYYYDGAKRKTQEKDDLENATYYVLDPAVVRSLCSASTYPGWPKHGGKQTALSTSTAGRS